MQCTENFRDAKIGKFPLRNFDIFLIFAQNIDCGYMLKSPKQSMF